MKFKIKQTELSKISKICQKIIESKNNLNNPILSYLKLSINKNNGSFVYCSNGISSSIYKINDEMLEIDENGKALIKNDILLDIVDKLNDEYVQITKIESSVLSLKTKNFTSQIYTIEDKFPSIEINEDNLIKFEINTSILNEINKKNSLVVFNDFKQIKPISGIYFTNMINIDQLTTMSTDTFRLVMLNNEFNKQNEQIKFIMNITTLNIINSMFKQNEIIEILIDDLNKKTIIKNNSIKIIDRSINGDYPKEIFINAFNLNVNTKFEIERQELLNSLELIKSVVKFEKNPSVIFEIDHENIKLNASSMEIGNININLLINNFIGENIKICFNINFLLSLVKNIDSKTIFFEIENNTKPVLIHGQNTDKFKQLLLPIRLNN